MVDTRALLPNGNDPSTVPPATVGPPDYQPGDPDGLVIIDEGTGRIWGQPPPVAPWSGWPADWSTPPWSWATRIEDASDIAWACLDLNANVLATMPPYLVGAANGLPAGWLTNPNPDLYLDWSEFIKQVMWDFMLGEAFVVCTARYSNGWPARFHVVDPWLVDVDLVDGRRVYRIGNLDVPDADMCHLRYTSRTSWTRGRGPLEVGRGRVIAANVLAQYATNLAASGGVPSSVLTHPAELTAEHTAELQRQWVQARMSTLGLPAVLSGGVTWAATQLDPAQMALLDLSQFNDSRIAVMLHTPPFLVGLPSGGDSLTYSTTESLFDYHWRSGLRPIAGLVMPRLSEFLVPYGTRIELNRDEYVQPGPLERAQAWATYHGIQDADGSTALTVPEIRLYERFDTPVSVNDPGVLR